MCTDVEILRRFHNDGTATKLDLAHCNLHCLPDELRLLCVNYPDVAARVEILNLAHNRLVDLPHWLTLLPNLRIMFCLANDFRHIPPVVRRLEKCTMISFKNCRLQGVLQATALPPAVHWLILTGNRIEALSDDFPATCARVRKLMLSNNRIDKLPHGFNRLHHLELLRIANNRLGDIPRICLLCPNLKWLALAGNPCVENLIPLPDLADVPPFHKFYSIHGAKALGAGTSGNVLKATRKSDNIEVAAKVFKASQGSDGRALDEVAVSLAARDIPGLVHAECAASSGDQLMLVTKLVPGEPRALANPPSFESCTRSVYDEGVKFTHEDATHIVRTVRNALHRLHRRGIAHGDVYAHNVLVGERQEDGNLSVALGDLGAAWPFPREIEDEVCAIERRALEVLEKEVMQRRF